jgi:threonine synthase
MNIKSKCFGCGKFFDLLKQFTFCPICSGALVSEGQETKKYFQYLLKKYQWLSLGEGNTSLICLENNLFAKCETQNPTGSFKDRGSLLEVAFALENNYKTLVFASTGNMAVSLSAYCAKAKIKCRVLVPKSTPPEKIELPKLYGAEIEVVDGNYDLAASLAIKESLTGKKMLVGDYLLRRVGQESCGREIAGEVSNVDWLIVPVGNGTIFSSVTDGYFGSAKNLSTKMIGVQGKKCNPVFRAWKNNEQIVPLVQPETVGAFFKVGNPGDGNLVLDCLKKSGGVIIEAGDEELIKAKKDLARNYGLLVNYASASVWTAYDKLLKKKVIKSKDKVVLVLTGR